MSNIDKIEREIENTFRPRHTYTHESKVVKDYFNMCLKHNLKPLREFKRIFTDYEGFYDDCLESMKEKLPDYIPPHIRRKDSMLLFHMLGGASNIEWLSNTSYRYQLRSNCVV